MSNDPPSSSFSEDRPRDADRSRSEETSFRELQDLIVGPVESQVEGLRTRLDDQKVRARELSHVLPEAIVRRSSQDDQLAKALTPTVEQAIQFSVKKHLRVFADALFPVIGPAIRKAIAEALRGMMQSLNQALENAFSWKGLIWRWEAFRTGKPFSEIVLLHSLVFRVEQIFLIHRETGLMLQHLARDPSDAQDGDMVSGMLTAIRDFVADSFQVQEHESLETIRVGELTVWIEPGPGAILAVVIRGNAPEHLRTVLRESLEKIHAQYEEAMEAFDGDTVVFESVRPILEDCLVSQYKEEKKKTSPVFLAVVGGILAVFFVWLYVEIQDSLRWRHFLTLLKSQEGIVVTDVDSQDGKYLVRGLRDDLSPDPSLLVHQAGIPTDTVVFKWTPYQALTDSITLRRARNILSPPDTVVLRLHDGTLTAEGSAPHDWLVEARHVVRTIPGIKAFQTEGLREENLEEIRAFEQYMDMLKREKGVVVTSSGRKGGNFFVSGLLDPLAANPADLLKAFHLNDSRVLFHWEPYQSLDPSLIVERANRLLHPPSTVSINVQDGCLEVRGSAPHHWIIEFRRWMRTIPGAPCVLDHDLVDLDMEELREVKASLEKLTIPFSANSAKPLPDQDETMEKAVLYIQRLLELSHQLRLLILVQIQGHTDQMGSEERNLRLSRLRADRIYDFMVSKGIPSSFLSVQALGSSQALSESAAEDTETKSRRVSFTVSLSPTPRQNPVRANPLSELMARQEFSLQRRVDSSVRR